MSQPPRHGQPWSREELILAFELYCRIPFRKTKGTNPQVRDLANLIGRTPASVARKLGNFGACDPELAKRQITGLSHTSHADREIWEDFHRNWPALVTESHKLRLQMAEHSGSNSVTPSFPSGPSERVAMTSQRVHQAFFRDAVLSSYDGMCCITRLPMPEVLIASHIVPWSLNESLRADPTNGVCLSATFDKLFDCGMISISPRYGTVMVSAGLGSSSSPVVRADILRFADISVFKPARFGPNPDHLAWHVANVFRG